MFVSVLLGRRHIISTAGIRDRARVHFAGCAVRPVRARPPAGAASFAVMAERQFERTYEGAVEAARSLQSIGMSLEKYQQSRHNTLDAMNSYVRRLKLQDEIAKLSVIHVTGTKGKGSTCAFTESILRAHGVRTGMYTSPHLIEVTERFRINGLPCDRDVYTRHFWEVWDALQATKGEAGEFEPMPNFFRFLTLVAFRMFAREKIDVAILEVGIGGRLDATNVVPRPVACGVASIGFDHMELLGHTLEAIATEKAGIFKPGAPAFTTEQEPSALAALARVAASVGAPLHVAPPSSAFSPKEAVALGLEGEHQRGNAGLALCLSHAWLAACRPALAAASPIAPPGPSATAPVAAPAFELSGADRAGLASVRWPGRAEREQHPAIANMTVYLDGAHTQESLAACAAWFAQASADAPAGPPGEAGRRGRRVMLFNCATDRDARLVLRPLARAAAAGLFDAVVFCPMISSKPAILPPSAQAGAARAAGTWQHTLLAAWQALVAEAGGPGAGASAPAQVIPSLPEAIAWAEGQARELEPSGARLHALFCGSLYLVGDTLRLLGFPSR